MKILIVGNGGREHALAWRLSREAEIISTPMNPGIAKFGTCFNIGVEDLDGIVNLAVEQGVDLAVVGPEVPLTMGLTDKLQAKGIAVFGPNQKAAQIEGSKTFSKELMKKYGIPTAAFEVFTDAGAAEAYIDEQGAPIVIKASGLAAGKGAVVCMTVEEAKEAVRSMMVDKQFGAAGNEVVIEEFMEGEEASILVITDGENLYILPSSQDHKRALDGDQGPNTGGMGAYAPAPCMTADLLEQVQATILKPTLDAMKSEGCPYSGVLYAGLMLTDDGPKVVEFNCRFGDPETQAVLPLVEGNFAEMLMSCAKGKLDVGRVKYKDGCAVCVVLASGGYPGSYEKEKEINGLAEAEQDAVVFHAGTKAEGDKIITSGGRVLGVTALADDLQMAIDKSYEAVAKISFEKQIYRKDIGAKGIKLLKKEDRKQ